MAAAVGWVAWQALWAHGGDRRLPWVDLTDRMLDRPTVAGVHVLREPGDALKALPEATFPPIDFRRRTAILVAAGPRSSTAYGLEIVSVVEERRRIVLRVRERAPSLARPGAATLGYPFRLITIERSRKPVVVERIGRP